MKYIWEALVNVVSTGDGATHDKSKYLALRPPCGLKHKEYLTSVLDLMKLFSSARLKPYEVLGAFINIQTYRHPILPPDMYYFVPILVTKFVQPYTFEPHFMGSRSPVLDIYTMREFRFPYVYSMKNYHVDPPKPKVFTSYSFQYDIYNVEDIQIPGELKVGDVIISVSGK